MKTVKSDDFLHVQGDGHDRAEIVETPEQQEDNQLDIPTVVHELAQDISAFAVAAAYELGLVTKFEECRGVFFGTVALASGKMEQYLEKQPDTPANEIELEINDLIKDTSINQVRESDAAIKTDLQLEMTSLEVAAAANIVSKATEPHTKSNRWSLLPWS